MPRLSLSAGLHATTTAHLAQTMALLELGGAELEEAVRAELDNPALEVVEVARCRACGRPLQRGGCPVCASANGGERRLDDAPIVYLTPREWERGDGYGGGQADFEPDSIGPEVPAPEKLAEHILRQIGPDLPIEDRPLAATLLFSLDENGLLSEAPAELAVRLRLPLARVQRVLRQIQRADPPGVATAIVEESLLAQLDALAEQPDAPPAALLALARALVGGVGAPSDGEGTYPYFRLLARHEYATLARLLNVSRPEIEAAALFIRHNLTPYPARAFAGSAGTPLDGGGARPFYHPDVTIHLHPNRTDGPLLVEITTPTSGWLRVNPAFRQALRALPEAERENWQQYYERALLYTKCLQQRNNTMRRLMESIAARQREFVLRGDRFLTPMTRVELSRQLGVHESTISRAVSDKSVALPGGRVVPMARFFDRSLSVREVIKNLIAAEPPTAPLTDERIVSQLQHEGIHIARRTVAKYRAAEGILPAALRSLRNGRAAARADAASRRGSEPSPAASRQLP